jgi:hypothetical protein
MAWIMISAALLACQTPVSQVTTINSRGSLPLGKGHTVYVGTGDGNGVLVYHNGATNWVQEDWLTVATTNPAVIDLKADASGTVYAAVSSGLIWGSGSSWTTAFGLGGVNGVTLNNGNVYVATTIGVRSAPAGSGSFTSPASITDASNDHNVRSVVFVGSSAYATTTGGIFYSTNPEAASPTYVNASSSGYPLTGFINTFAYDGSNYLYAGTPLGLSYVATSGTNWTGLNWAGMTAGALSSNPAGPVNGIVIPTSGPVLLATDAGLSYGSGSSWNNLATSTPLLDIVQGPDSSTFYAANGYNGLAIITATGDTNSPYSMTTVLSGVKVTKVFVTVP